MTAFESRLERILEATGCKEYHLYLTGKGNFREDIATIKPYKGNRSGKPKLYKQMREWLQWKYQAEVVEGMEADDALAIEQTKSGDSTVICSRDKDLRIVEGWHYGYSCGKQPEFPMRWIDKLGYLDLIEKVSPKTGKSTFEGKGGGLSFFYFQMLLGDSTDNIQGVPKWGDKKSYELLKGYTDDDNLMFFKVLEIYEQVYGDTYVDAFLENGDLLWMVNEIHDDGSPVLWSTFDSTLDRIEEYKDESRTT